MPTTPAEPDPAAVFVRFSAARRMCAAGILAAMVFGLVACGSVGQDSGSAVPVSKQQPIPGSSGGGYTAGMSLISNGTKTVRVGSRTVTFPTTVTDAAWSPDGSLVAFIDANGNVATAHPDGSGLSVLTTAGTDVARSDPSWFGGLVMFTEQDSKHGLRMESVQAAGNADQPEQLLNSGDVSEIGISPDTGNSWPSGAVDPTRQLADYGQITYEHQGADGPQVWIVDYSQRRNSGMKVVDGTDPAISPDGTEVAFVDGKGQIEVASTAVPAGHLAPALIPVQVTFSAANPTDLVWTPDGSRIAFSTSAGIESVAARIPKHATANPPTRLSSTPGTVTFLPSAVNQIGQFAGTDPVALSVSASEDRWPTVAQYATPFNSTPADCAVVGSSTALASDLALFPAAPGNGPLLLTSGAALDPSVAKELRRVLGTVVGAPGQVVPGQVPIVYLLGGPDQVSAAVGTAIQQLGYETRRITVAPPTSPPTSPPTLSSAQNNGPYRPMVVARTRAVLVDSASPLDELLGTAFAGYYRAPVVQVGRGGLTPAEQTLLDRCGGPVAPTVLFGPGPVFDGTFVTALAAREGGPLGFRLVADPADPAGP